MKRRALIAALVLPAAAAYGLYEVKYEVRGLERELAALNRTLLGDQEAVHILEAEWSYLTRPARLEKLTAGAELRLDLAVAGQMGRLVDLPIEAVAKPGQAANAANAANAGGSQ